MRDNGRRLKALGQSISEIEGWLDILCIKDPDKIAPVVNQCTELMTRLGNRLDLDYSEQLASDILIIGTAYLTLKYLIAYDHGYRFSDIYKFDETAKLRYSALYALATDQEDNLVVRGRQSINTISTLCQKYP